MLLLLAILTNFTYLIVSNGDYYFPDSFTYLGPARMLLTGHGFVTEPGMAETLRTPGYPLFLIPFLVFTQSAVPVVIVQHLMNVVLTAAIWLFTLRRTGSGVAAFLSGLFFAVDPVTIHYANKVLSETLFTAMLFAAFVLALQRKHLLALGLLLGALTLTRPVAIAYFVVVAIAMQLRGRALVHFLIVALILPLAWAERNEEETGVFTVSSIGASNLMMHRAAGALAMERGGDFDQALAFEQNRLQAEITPLILAGEGADTLGEVPHAVRGRYWGAFARRILLHHLRGFALVTLRGIRVNLFDSDWDSMGEVSELEDATVEPWITYGNAAMVILAFLGVALLWRSDRTLALLLGLTIVYFIVTSAGGESEGRFRVPVVPYLAIGAAVAVQRIASASRMRTSWGGLSIASAIALTTLRSFTG